MKEKAGKYMKRFLIVAILFAVGNIFFAQPVIDKKDYSFNEDTLTVVSPESYHSNIDKLISAIISRYHYKKTEFDDSLGSFVFDEYLQTLDINKMYLLKKDFEEFEAYRYKFDDYFLDGELMPAYRIFNTFKKRVNERIPRIDSILAAGFDFTLDEYYNTNRPDQKWAADKIELDKIWRKRLKNDALNLKLAGKDEDDIHDLLMKRYTNFQRLINQYKSEDVFQLIMNSYTAAIDPHTNYLSPITSDNFKIDMSLSLEGIGAQLQQDDEYIKIVDIIPGGPAYKSGLLEADDKIIGVAQGEEGEMVDLIGWRVTDAVQLIRGEKGSIVRLQILDASDGPNPVPKEIILERDEVKLEGQAAKSDVIEIEHEGEPYKMGVISIPRFYVNFDEQNRGIKDYKSTTHDVRKLLDSLKQENVDGVIIDLRNNGGGALSEAIALTGLFIEDGPVVQVKQATGEIELGKDPDPGIAYDGPLAVLINRFSASASEIFTGAIQDYKRGIIVGEQSFGKGTVQNLIDLNRLMRNNKDKFGQVKLTIAKFYRINGGSTQSLGVIPDIKYPSAFDADEFGESSKEKALPWDQIKSAEYEKYNPNFDGLISKLKEEHNKRIEENPEFDYIKEDIEEYKERKEQNLVSLNEEIRKQEKEEREEKRFERENERRKLKGLEPLDEGEKPSNHNNNDNDPLLKETAHIIADFIQLTIG